YPHRAEPGEMNRRYRVSRPAQSIRQIREVGPLPLPDGNHRRGPGVQAIPGDGPRIARQHGSSAGPGELIQAGEDGLGPRGAIEVLQFQLNVRVILSSTGLRLRVAPLVPCGDGGAGQAQSRGKGLEVHGEPPLSYEQPRHAPISSQSISEGRQTNVTQGTGALPCLAGSHSGHLRRASLYRSLPGFMRYRTSFVASYWTQVWDVVTKSFGSEMGFSQVDPPSRLSLMHVSARTNRCLESLAFSA